MAGERFGPSIFGGYELYWFRPTGPCRLPELVRFSPLPGRMGGHPHRPGGALATARSESVGFSWDPRTFGNLQVTSLGLKVAGRGSPEASSQSGDIQDLGGTWLLGPIQAGSV
jgi:hypothetical protein